MSSGDPIPRDTALAVANAFINHIKDVCIQIKIAGSLRRGRDDVHDIEIVASPLPPVKKQNSLDGDSILILPDAKQNNPLHDKMQALLSQNIIDADRLRRDNKRNPFGKKYYRINYFMPPDKHGTTKSYPVDLFVVLPPAQWGIIYLLRTGSADFSHWFVQQGRAFGIQVIDGHLEREGLALDTPTEQAAFKFMRVRYIEPDQRESVPVGARLIT